MGPLENEDGVGGAGSKFSDEQVVHQHFCWPPLAAHPTYTRLSLFVLLHFRTDLIGLRKNALSLFSNGHKLTALKIGEVLLA